MTHNGTGIADGRAIEKLLPGQKIVNKQKLHIMILQFKRNRSAGTAAQKRSKCSLLARYALLLAIPMLCAATLGFKLLNFK
jgi:hypothetical protein